MESAIGTGAARSAEKKTPAASGRDETGVVVEAVEIAPGRITKGCGASGCGVSVDGDVPKAAELARFASTDGTGAACADPPPPTRLASAALDAALAFAAFCEAAGAAAAEPWHEIDALRARVAELERALADQAREIEGLSASERDAMRKLEAVLNVVDDEYGNLDVDVDGSADEISVAVSRMIAGYCVWTRRYIMGETGEGDATAEDDKARAAVAALRSAKVRIAELEARPPATDRAEVVDLEERLADALEAAARNGKERDRLRAEVEREQDRVTELRGLLDEERKLRAMDQACADVVRLRAGLDDLRAMLQERLDDDQNGALARVFEIDDDGSILVVDTVAELADEILRRNRHADPLLLAVKRALEDAGDLGVSGLIADAIDAPEAEHAEILRAITETVRARLAALHAGPKAPKKPGKRDVACSCGAQSGEPCIDERGVRLRAAHKHRGEAPEAPEQPTTMRSLLLEEIVRAGHRPGAIDAGRVEVTHELRGGELRTMHYVCARDVVRCGELFAPVLDAEGDDLARNVADAFRVVMSQVQRALELGTVSAEGGAE